MCDDDSYNISTVPRSGRFGLAEDEDDDLDSTLGDRFFDVVKLQTNTVAKETDPVKLMMLRDRQGRISSTAEQVESEHAENGQEDAPFEINRLAMFRPPSRTRLSNRRSNTVQQEESAHHISTCTVQLSTDGSLRPNGCTDNETARGFSRNTATNGKKSSSEIGLKRSSVPRPLYPGQGIRQRSLSRENAQPMSGDVKPKMGPITRQQAISRMRTASGEPGIRASRVGTIRTNGLLTREATNNGIREARGPIRVRSISTDAVAPRSSTARAGTAASAARTVAQHQNGTKLRTVTNARNLAAGSVAIAATRKSPYVGPETRARARMKQNCQTQDLPDSTTATVAPQRVMPVKSAHVRPLSQLNPNLPPQPRNTAKNIGATASVDKVTASGHLSRPRTRAVHGPIRIQNVQGIVKGNDGLPPVGSESRFRHSVTRRLKGGDSLDRDVTQEEKENGGDVWTVTAKKPTPILEFAPCLRSRVAAKKTKSGAGATAPPMRLSAVPQSGHLNTGGGDGMQQRRRRRTEAEREAFFRRLSTPKTVANINKGNK